MTEKQEKILTAALELFAEDGFRTTSTSKVAAKAGVSEGLIFRHFKNKEGLLEAIIQQAEEKVKVLFADVIMEQDPKEIIRKTVEMGQKLSESEKEAHFWKLQYKIKWETENYGEHKMEPLRLRLTEAFNQLGYPNAAMEAMHLLMALDGMATRFYLSPDFNLDEAISYLKTKYEL